MAAPTKTPNSREEQDNAYNPGDLHAAERFGSSYTDAGTDQAEAFANDPANATKKQEENPRGINYTGSGKQPKGGRRNFRGQLKKKGPLAGIFALLIGGFAGISVFFAPGLAVVHMSEVLTNDLNDQLGAMDLRTTHVFKSKLKGLGKNKSLCVGGVKVRCGFRGMSKRQIKAFEKAGITIETDGKTNKFRKSKISRMVIKTSDGVSHKITTPREFNRLLGDRSVRNSIRRAFNPKFAGFSDFVSNKVLKRLKTSKAKKITGSTDKEKNKSLNKAVKGTQAELSINNRTTSDSDDKKTAKENKQHNSDANKAASEFNTKETGSTKSLFGSVAKNGVKNAGKGLLITGIADTACTVKNTARAVNSTAKIVRAAQLARFAMTFLTFASAVKAGDATADQAEYVGNKLTSVDTDKMVVNETSKTDGDKAIPVKNPDYGKSALDSDGFKVAAYNEAPTLSARSLEYTVGGTPLMGTLSSLNSQLNVSAATCSIIQNGFVRVGSLAIGIAFSVGTAGLGTAALVGGSVAVGMALPILQHYLGNMLAGTVVDADTKGVDAGNAIFAGTAKLQGDVAMNRGMEPQSKSEFKQYVAATKGVKDDYIAMETKDAHSTPFDIYNQYSFLGSFARKLLPLETAQLSTAGYAMNSISFIGSTLVGAIPKANAEHIFNDARFTKCNDPGYDDVGIDADVFCNVRYGLSTEELAMDTDNVIDYMYPTYLDAEGEPQGAYKDWLKECVNRTAGWGEKPDGKENGGNGEECKKDSTQLSNFRVYTMDSSIEAAMDYVEPTGGSESGDSNISGGPGSIKGGDDYVCTPLSKQFGLCGQCTDFVTFRLQKLTGSKKYKNNNGNGKDFARQLSKKYNFAYNHKPAAGAIVSFAAGQLGMNSTFGHVGMVKQVNSDGSIVIEDYNRQSPKAYGTLTIKKSDAGQLSYAHSEVDYK